MEQIKINKAQPIPEKGGRKSTTVYPFESMKVNESFTAGEYTPELINKMNSTIHYYGKKLRMKFCLRKVNDKLTVWRSE